MQLFPSSTRHCVPDELTVEVALKLLRGADPRRLERYFETVRAGGSRPVLVVNKMDLVADPEAVLAATRVVAQDTQVLALSALRGDGVDVITGLLAPGQTAAVVGSSGVGKSTLINALHGARGRADRFLDDEPVLAPRLLNRRSGGTVMKARLMRSIALTLSLLTVGGSLAIAEQPGGDHRRGPPVVAPPPQVPNAPPPAPRADRPGRPRRGMVWMEGRWDWQRGRWVWVTGRWQRPEPGKRWPPGRAGSGLRRGSSPGCGP